MNLPIDYKGSYWSVRREARELYIIQQAGRCYHCGSQLDGEPDKEILRKKINRRLFPKNFFKYPVHLHHCHITGMSIGAVHSKCNAVLWQYHGE